MKKTYLLALALVSTTAMAETVSEASARAKAESILSSSNLSLAYTATKGSETYYYVFNCDDPKLGFAIIGGDDLATDVLGYSPDDTFDPANVPDQMRWMLDEYESYISYTIAAAQAGGLNSDNDIVHAMRAPKHDIAPIVTVAGTPVQWNQENPYYLAIGDATHRYHTGCTSTATAQIMRYYKYPAQDVGMNIPSSPLEGGGTAAAISGVFTYNWDLMKTSYDPFTSYSLGESDIYNLANLFFRLGRSIDAKYGLVGVSGTSSSTYKMGQSLIDNFKYDKSIYYYTRNFFTDTDWEDLLYNELVEGRPTIYAAYEPDTDPKPKGHAFICDGYDATSHLFHINWGWGGHYDGYYAVSGAKDVLNPGTHNYVRNHDVLLHIMPDAGNDYVYEAMATLYSLSSTSIQYGSPVQIMGTVQTSSYPGLTAVGLMFVDKADPTKRFTSARGSLSGRSSFTDMQVSMPGELEVGHIYYVYPAYKDQFDTWQKCRLYGAQSDVELTVIAPDEVCLSKAPTVSNNGNFTALSDLNVEFALSNYTSADWACNVSLYFYKVGESGAVAKGTYSATTLTAGTTHNFSASESNIAMLSGKVFEQGADYTVYVYDHNAGKFFSPYTTIHCKAATPLNWTLSSAQWGTLCLPFDADIPAGLTAYSVTGINSSDVLIKVPATTLLANKPYLINGTPGTYNFSGPASAPGTFCNGLLYGVTTEPAPGEEIYAPKDSYILQNNASGLGFYHVSSSNKQKIRPYSAFLKTDISLSRILLFDDDELAIETLPAEEPETEGTSFNLMGQPTNSRQGFVIKNGKLNFVK